MSFIYVVKEYERTIRNNDQTELGYYTTFDAAKQHVEKIAKAIERGRHHVEGLTLYCDFHMLDEICAESGYLAEIAFRSGDRYDLSYTIERYELDAPRIYRMWETE